MLTDLSIEDFLSQSASGSPTPGGGSIAALSASLSASLTEMVANLTIGKKGYEKCEEKMKVISKKALERRRKFTKDIERDSEAYRQVMAAYNLPKSTKEEISARKQAVQKALEHACLVPLGVAVDTVDMMGLIKSAVENGNRNAQSDGFVAAIMARSAVLSALCNVKINLKSIEDQAFVKKITRQAVNLEDKAVSMEKEILQTSQIYELGD